MTHFLETYHDYPNELTPTQVSKILHCTQMMLYKMLSSSDCELDYYRVGNRYWITKDSVRKYILKRYSGTKDFSKGE